MVDRPLDVESKRLSCRLLPADHQDVHGMRRTLILLAQARGHLSPDHLQIGDAQPGCSQGVHACLPPLGVSVVETEHHDAVGLERACDILPNAGQPIFKRRRTIVLHVKFAAGGFWLRVSGKGPDLCKPRVEEVGKFGVVHLVEVGRVGQHDIHRCVCDLRAS